jgi:hypothetical protein
MNRLLPSTSVLFFPPLSSAPVYNTFVVKILCLLA